MEAESESGSRCRWGRRDQTEMGRRESIIRAPGGHSGHIQSPLEENLMKGSFTELWVGLEGAKTDSRAPREGGSEEHPFAPASKKPR